MKITVIGTVAKIGDEKTFGTMRKRDLVLCEGGDAERPLCVEFTAGERSDHILPLLALKIGDLVRVEAILSGREWEGRYYTRITGASVRTATFANPAAALPSPSADAAAPSPGAPADLSDLPF